MPRKGIDRRVRVRVDARNRAAGGTGRATGNPAGRPAGVPESEEVRDHRKRLRAETGEKDRRGGVRPNQTGRPQSSPAPAGCESGQFYLVTFFIPIWVLTKIVDFAGCESYLERMWYEGESDWYCCNQMYQAIKTSCAAPWPQMAMEVRSHANMLFGRRLVAWPSLVHIRRPFRALLCRMGAMRRTIMESFIGRRTNY